MPLSTFWYIKACVVCAYDLYSLFVILWEHSPCWTLGLNLTAQSMLLFVMDWCLFLSTSTESHQFNGAESAPVSLPLPWHWKQLWVFSLQHNPYFCISGFIWSFEDLIMRRNIYVCVYIGIDVVESIFLPFFCWWHCFSLVCSWVPGGDRSQWTWCSVLAIAQALTTACRHSEIIWDACGWVGCHYSSKWCICPAGLALPAPSQGWGRGQGNTLSPPRTWPPNCLPLWWRKTWNPHTDLSVSLLLSMGEEMPQLPSFVLLLCKGERVFPATHPVEWIILHIQSSEKKKWGLSHLTARSCLPEQDRTLVPVI